jgi:nicotinate-nucleotide--dimethylbenzimidazole phosphoribosyltransferase
MIDLIPEVLTTPDNGCSASVAHRAAQVLRPAGAFARLDEVAAWLAGWQRTTTPSVTRPAAVVFAGDHGVTTQGVSAYPQAITTEMLKALQQGAATASAMARVVGAELSVVDVGVGVPTGDITHEDALTVDRFERCWSVGRDAVGVVDTDLLVLGEMGIGNTTVAAAVTAALYGLPASELTGRGTGVDDATFAHKIEVVEAARARVTGATPLEVLRRTGGSELVAMAGALVAARERSIPVVLDGFVVTAAAAVLEAERPGALDHCIAGHRSPEPGHSMTLEKLAMEPLIDLGLRLGEGSGALAAVPLIRLACASVVDVATFEEWGIPT